MQRSNKYSPALRSTTRRKTQGSQQLIDGLSLLAETASTAIPRAVVVSSAGREWSRFVGDVVRSLAQPSTGSDSGLRGGSDDYHSDGSERSGQRTLVP